MNSAAENLLRRLRWLAVPNVIIGLGTFLTTSYLTFVQDAQANAGLINKIVFIAAAVIVTITLFSVLGIRKPPELHGMPETAEPLAKDDKSKIFFSLAFVNAGLNFVLISLLIGVFVTNSIPANTTSYLAGAILFVTGIFLMLRVVLLTQSNN